MPFYDYRCNNLECRSIQEFFEKPSDDTLNHQCNECKCSMHRIITKGNNFWLVKNLPSGHNLSAAERKKLWNSDDPKDFKKVAGWRETKDPNDVDIKHGR